MVRQAFGFTILELLIVIAVIALLVSMVALAVKAQILKARDARRKADVAEIQIALEHYYNDFERYPVASLVQDCGGNGLAPYLKAVPCDLVTKQAYGYVVDPDGQRYELYVNLEWKSDRLIEAVGCSSGCGPNGSYNYGVASAGTQLGQIIPLGGPGIQPQCGDLGNWFCFANVCSECCPGSDYRCNGAGTRCILDATCGN